ncbi:hypothetical protein A5727_02195 [Mycobacterium sp. ACS4331]|nr:hypothetical protein A5727_02195 [Mycobacterium sp. ACS4331]
MTFVAVAAAGLGVAPAASADCTFTRGTMICSDGGPPKPSPQVTGSGPQQPSVTQRGSFTPYPCTIDWFCETDYGIGVGDALYGHN